MSTLRRALVLATSCVLACAGSNDSDDTAAGESTGSQESESGSETGTPDGTTAAESTGSQETGSSSDTGGPLTKGVIDEFALATGVTVQLSADGATGEVSVPLLVPVPSVSAEALQQALLPAASCTVTSVESGATASLAGGVLGTMLDMAGAWTWELDEARDVVTIRFVNETPGGLALTPGRSYSAVLSLSTNLYVERVSTFTFMVTVQQ